MSIISIIVPIYNVEAYLERCIQSLIGQSYSNLEIILVDDGSTDDSLSICQMYAQQDSRIKIIHKENGGLASARNTGIKAATGEYIGFVDSDDWVDLDTYQAMRILIQQHHPDVIRFGYQKISDGRTQGQYHLSYDAGLYTDDALRQIQLDTISTESVLDYRKKKILSACTGVYRRRFLDEHQIWFVSEREILNEDYLFVLQSIQSAESLYVSQDELYYYDTRPNSLTTTYRINMYEKKKKLYKRYCSVLPLNDPEIAFRLRNFYIDCIYACIVNEITSKKPFNDAIRAIRMLLGDARFQEYLRINRPFTKTAKAKCIYYLMRYRMTIGIYLGYRLLKK